MSDVIVNVTEARDEARRLTKVHGREVETSIRDCWCDYNANCGKCGGEGSYYLLIFASCGHLVGDGSGEDCEQRKCIWRETESFMEAMELAEEALA